MTNNTAERKASEVVSLCAVRGGRVAQLEDGYTQLANTLLEALAGIELSGRQYRVVLAIVRKTYGYQKKTDWLSADQIARVIGYDGAATNIYSDIRTLKERNILKMDGRAIGLNTNIGDWKSDRKQSQKRSKSITPEKRSKTITNVIENDHSSDRKQSQKVIENDHHKRKKETYTKKNNPLTPFWPDGLNVEAFEEFLDYRKEIKRPYKSQRSLTQAANQLISLAGGDMAAQRAIVNQSIANQWQGLFALKHYSQPAQQGISIEENLNEIF